MTATLVADVGHAVLVMLPAVLRRLDARVAQKPFIQGPILARGWGCKTACKGRKGGREENKYQGINGLVLYTQACKRSEVQH